MGLCGVAVVLATGDVWLDGDGGKDLSVSYREPHARSLTGCLMGIATSQARLCDEIRAYYVKIEILCS